MGMEQQQQTLQVQVQVQEKSKNKMSSVIISSIEHAYATAISDAKKVGKFIENSVLPVLQKAHADASLIESITATVSPDLANIERVGDALLGTIINAIDGGKAVVDANGVNVTLDASLVADIKAILPAVKNLAAASVNAVKSTS